MRGLRAERVAAARTKCARREPLRTGTHGVRQVESGRHPRWEGPLLHSLSAGCSFASRGLATVRDPDGPVELMDPGPQRVALSRLTCPQAPERLAGLDSCDF